MGKTARHLTFFEMLGNFSIGDYFKPEAIAFGWELSTQGFGLDPERIWVTVFEGDDELGLGPDEESIELWRAQGVPEERIVRLPRSENFWQAGPSVPADRARRCTSIAARPSACPATCPATTPSASSSTGTTSSWPTSCERTAALTDLPQRNIDTGMGLERMAAILQDVPSVFETDLFAPLIELAEEMSGRGFNDDDRTRRAMRIVADHSRGTANLIADGVVPSNEDRGYILRRIMRRAIQQGRVLELEPPFMRALRRSRDRDPGGCVPAARRRARHGDALGLRRGATASGARSSAAPNCSTG